MQPITTETLIMMGEFRTIYTAQRVVVKVRDEAGGPYLSIEGIDEEPTSEGNEHQFYLCSEAEINEFSEILKETLRDAETAYKNGRKE